MYDYISDICIGQPLRTPAADPLDNIPGSLRLQLGQISLTMGDAFSRSFFSQLRLALTRTELDSYRDGFQTGTQLMLTMLEDCG